MLEGRSDSTIKYTSFVALFLGLGLAAWLIFWSLGKGSIDLIKEFGDRSIMFKSMALYSDKLLSMVMVHHEPIFALKIRVL